MTSSVCIVADGLHLVEPDLLAGVEDERVLRGVNDVICRVLRRGVDDVICLLCS
jgi:hypothetical protein